MSYGKATPYVPVVDLLKRYVHVEDGDDARTIRAKITGQIVTWDETLQETIPVLCHRGLGTLYRQTGQSDQARTALSTAVAMYREMEMTFWLPETEAALVEVEGRP